VRVDYTLDTLRLEALAPAATLFADVPPASGRVGGSGHWEWQGGLRLSGRTELTLQSVRVEGASAGGQPLVVPDTTLTAEAQLDDAGGGRQTLALVSGTLLDLRWDGTVAGLLGERPSLEGALALGGELGGLFDLAREPLALQPGVGLSGQLRGRHAAPRRVDAARVRRAWRCRARSASRSSPRATRRAGRSTWA
jgi:hypothetical protein